MAQQCSTRHVAGSRAGYLPIEDYGMIGNMHTCALVGTNGSVDFMCWYEAGFFPTCLYATCMPPPPPRADVIFGRVMGPPLLSSSLPIVADEMDNDKRCYMRIIPMYQDLEIKMS